MEFNELLKRFKLSMREISEELDIPYRTIQNWHLGQRKAPLYLINLINYYYINKKRKR